MFWKVQVNGAPVYDFYEDQACLNQFLATLPAGEIVVVTRFDAIQQETTIYGVSGGNTPPQAPQPPVVPIVTPINHITR